MRRGAGCLPTFLIHPKSWRPSTVAIAPMRLGGGQQYKVLEALALGIPVIMTPHANIGLGFPQKLADSHRQPDELPHLCPRSRVSG